MYPRDFLKCVYKVIAASVSAAALSPLRKFTSFCHVVGHAFYLVFYASFCASEQVSLPKFTSHFSACMGSELSSVANVFVSRRYRPPCKSQALTRKVEERLHSATVSSSRRSLQATPVLDELRRTLPLSFRSCRRRPFGKPQ